MRRMNFARPGAAFSTGRKPAVKPQKLRADALTDGQMLDILDRHEAQGQTLEQIGRVYGRSRAAIGGVIKRIRDDVAASEAGSRVTRPEHRDGAMGRRWWQAGLDARGRY